MRYPIDPVPKPRMTRRDRWKKRPCVLRYHRFKDQCRVRRVKLPQPCHVVFHIAMPKSWSAQERADARGEPHDCKPDIDNLGKALLDAVLKDDSWVWDIRFSKRWSDKGAIEILPLGDE